jgi:cobalt-zinc-cadmium efflux system outer membrane protein
MLNEEVARAGMRLARAQSIPDLTLFTKYSRERSAFDDTPVGPIFDKDNLLTFGVSISIPVFNRNQGARGEAALAITQAQRRREFAEQVVRAEVASAYTRYKAAQAAVDHFEKGVIPRSTENIRVFREAYNLGEYRISDLINEQRRLVDSQREFTEALAERYRALADLQSAIGSNTP